MSDTPAQTADKPEAAAKPAEKSEAAAAKPAAAEPPFNTDVLESCTSRYTRKAYNLYLQYRGDKDKIENAPVRFTLEADSVDAAEEIHKTLVEAGVSEISRQDKTVSMTSTFKVLERVVKRPETRRVDAVAV